MGITYSQFFPPAPKLTEKNLPSQSGKVFIVTGGASGVGLELVRILYHAGGKVYIAGRSEANAKIAIEDIKSSQDSGSGAGQLEFLHLQLEDLSTISATVETFSSKESRLDVLFNNAGVSLPPLGSTSKQGHELQVATNCLGHFLFTELLLPLLKSTAKSAPTGSVRVVWTSSVIVDLGAPNGGFSMDALSSVTPKTGGQDYYFISKVGNWLLASELANQVGKDGIISITQNPGNLSSNLTRHVRWADYVFYLLLHHAKFGAYTELWAGLSPDLQLASNGGYVLPWGRIHPSPRPDLLAAMKTKEEDGTGLAKAFRDWCELQTNDFRSSTQ